MNADYNLQRLGNLLTRRVILCTNLSDVNDTPNRHCTCRDQLLPD